MAALGRPTAKSGRPFLEIADVVFNSEQAFASCLDRVSRVAASLVDRLDQRAGMGSTIQFSKSGAIRTRHLGVPPNPMSSTRVTA
jgi:hypothetical protein